MPWCNDLMIICTKLGKNLSRTACVVELIWKDVLYSSSFIVKLWMNDLEDIGQSQVIEHNTPFILVIICAKYGKNSARTVKHWRVDLTVLYSSSFIAKLMANWPWSLRSRVIAPLQPFIPVIICVKYGKKINAKLCVLWRQHKPCSSHCIFQRHGWVTLKI